MKNNAIVRYLNSRILAAILPMRGFGPSIPFCRSQSRILSTELPIEYLPHNYPYLASILKYVFIFVTKFDKFKTRGNICGG